MKIEISQTSSDNKVRLDYKSSPTKPSNIPAYIIDKEKADEFVKEYNTQSKNLQKITTASILSGAILGGFTLSKSSGKLNKILKTIIGVITGVIAGAIVSAVISYKKKNNLMNSYDVYKI